jgi:uncharacterized cupredoxin-like copper-binding protein
MSRFAALAAVAALMTVPVAPASAGPGAPGHAHEFGAGEPGDPSKPARLVPVTMRETDDGRMVFFPAKLDVKAGEQVRFKITNAGKADHEFMLDTVAHNATHKLAMEKHPGMEHDDPNGKSIPAGQSADVLWKFSKPGTFEFACLVPGHYEAGMHSTVVVR